MTVNIRSLGTSGRPPVETLEITWHGRKAGTAVKQDQGLYLLDLTVLDTKISKRIRVREQFRIIEIAEAVTGLLAAPRTPA